MMKAIDYIRKAEKEGIAIGHFNISDVVALRAIFDAARELRVPVFIGVSEGEREFIGIRQTKALVDSLREEYNYPIFLNADHTYSFEKIKEVIDSGYDSVIFDGAKLDFEENVKRTKEVVEYARSRNPEILVEAELGYIGSSSKIYDKIPEGAGVRPTTPEEAKQFVEETKIDLLAPAVGNIHGMLKGVKNPRLDIDRVRAIQDAAGVPLVLHGGSGIEDEDFKNAIKAGISMVHINTEIRKAWRDGVEAGLRDNPDEVAPYKVLPPAYEGIKKVVLERLRLFSGI
ncbi:MAG TPA: class II fructose-bisphosphate aldolase [Candidatus Paceibacterota bacterium]